MDSGIKKISDQNHEIYLQVSYSISGIRIIKYNVWEKHFAEAVNGIRNRELKFSFIIKLLIGGIICVWGMTVSIMLLLSVGECCNLFALPSSLGS